MDRGARGGHRVFYTMEGSIERGMVEDDMRAIEDHSGLEERSEGRK